MDSPVTVAGFTESRSQAIQAQPEAQSSGVSWPAVAGGAFVTAAVYLILLALGAGFGLSVISPWSGSVSESTAGNVALGWVVFIEIVASVFGGYLTGRLRTKWTHIHDDEVFFRDTANGFLSWAVALVVSMAFLTAAAASMTGSARQVSSPANTSASIGEPNAYYIDSLFRSERAPESNYALVQAEAARILGMGLRQNQMAPADQAYLSRLVMAVTGIGQTDADRRVTEVTTAARDAEDAARKATARFLLWMFLALLMGAFTASYAATIGGRQRDRVKAV